MPTWRHRDGGQALSWPQQRIYAVGATRAVDVGVAIGMGVRIVGGLAVGIGMDWVLHLE